jgi:hypothetical protein
MDYMELIKRSISNAWKYKFLWLFGFFVSVADGFGGGHWWTDKFDRKCAAGFGEFGGFHIDSALLIFLALAAFSLWVLFWIMSVLSEGSLIHGISRKELKLKVSFSDCWSVGLAKFFRLFGIMLLATFAVLVAIIFMALVIVPSYFASIPLGVALTILALPVLFILIIAAVSVEGWAIRFAILNDQRWLDAIGKGWNLFKNNFWKTLGVAFSSFFTQLILWCALIVGMLILAVPFLLLGIASFWLGLIPGIMLGLLIIILSSAFFGTFASSIWTLGFMQMTGYAGPQAVPVADTTPPTTE